MDATIFENDSALWRRFLQLPENENLNKRIKYFDYAEYLREISFVISKGDKIIAMAGLQKSPYEADVFWIKYVSVDPDYQKSGLATLLVKMIFKYAKSKNHKLQNSSYSEQGWNFLKPVLLRENEKYGGYILVHKDEKMF